MMNLIEPITVQQVYRELLTPDGEHHGIGDGDRLAMTKDEDPPLRSPKRTPDLASR